ncbi:hypothetical protein [Novosphingobium sp. 9U]|uniref:hypothetical protein n=1 Tax=Novosphingobium sp. 9U TaxID=2653158 RepID=UPI00135B2DA3|nr:hypothetical protein [Novosphingobium sp. 9U]
MPDGTVERAFQLASDGSSKSVNDVRRQLKQEGYTAIDEHLSGPTIKKQLAELMKGR